MNYVLFFISLIAGAGISFLNYLLSRYVMKNHPEKYALLSGVRQIINISYLFLLFFAARVLELDSMILLFGGAIGVTVPSFFFTAKLINCQNKKDKEKEDSNG